MRVAREVVSVASWVEGTLGSMALTDSGGTQRAPSAAVEDGKSAADWTGETDSRYEVFSDRA